MGSFKNEMTKKQQQHQRVVLLGKRYVWSFDIRLSSIRFTIILTIFICSHRRRVRNSKSSRRGRQGTHFSKGTNQSHRLLEFDGSSGRMSSNRKSSAGNYLGSKRWYCCGRCAWLASSAVQWQSSLSTVSSWRLSARSARSSLRVSG